MLQMHLMMPQHGSVKWYSTKLLTVDIAIFITGHTAAKVYAHAIQSATAASAEMMDSLLNPIKKQA